ncbi:MAG: phosphatase PAP2 family protein, partial [Chloroflexi bacterium]|nr:phosphatase PAP2 family protein [Chloroflexota bacterium]
MNVSFAVRDRVQAWRALVAPASPTGFSVLVAALIAIGLALFNAALIVQTINLYHAFALDAPLDKAVAMRHGAGVFALERHLRLAVEPGVQGLLSQAIYTPLGVIPAPALRHAVVWVYLNALPVWLFAALAWNYLYKPRYFPVVRDLTIVSILLAVVCYRTFPTAPPRFVLHGAPYYLVDWTYSGTSIDARVVHMVGFNPYAAFPSVHMLWATIPALCLAIGSRKVWVWMAALCYPLVMLIVVISSGNHYLLDCAGSLSVLAISALLVAGARRAFRGIARRDKRYELPAALGLCVICAGVLAVVGVNGGLRVWVAACILVLIVYASGRSPYLWRGHRRLGDGRQVTRPADYLAGLLFIAGASGAAHLPGQFPSTATRVCALLWLLACMAALYPHVTARRPLSRRGYDLGDALRQFRCAQRSQPQALASR